MKETLVDRIQKRLAELQLPARRASLKVSDNKDLIAQVVRKGADANPTDKTVSLIATALGVSPQWLRGETETHPTSSQPTIASALAASQLDVPVFGTVAGAAIGKGAFKLTDEAIDYVGRPPGLKQARDVYALYVEGDSMEPRFFAGDLVFVHPHKPVRAGDVVVIQEPDSNNGMPVSFIKTFKRRTHDALIASQYNPVSEIEFKNAARLVVHKVLSNVELFGA